MIGGQRRPDPAKARCVPARKRLVAPGGEGHTLLRAAIFLCSGLSWPFLLCVDMQRPQRISPLGLLFMLATRVAMTRCITPFLRYGALNRS